MARSAGSNTAHPGGPKTVLDGTRVDGDQVLFECRTSLKDVSLDPHE